MDSDGFLDDDEIMNRLRRGEPEGYAEVIRGVAGRLGQAVTDTWVSGAMTVLIDLGVTVDTIRTTLQALTDDPDWRRAVQERIEDEPELCPDTLRSLDQAAMGLRRLSDWF